MVTGAGSGIGRATALRLAGDGAAVGCLGLDEEALTATAEAIRAAGGRAIPVLADVTDRAAVEAGAAAIAIELGPIGIVVNNAGIPGEGRFIDARPEAWQRVIDVHVTGAYNVTQAILPAMLQAGWGRVITIASEAIWLGNTSVQYATAKAALLGFTRALARQVAPSGVLVNAVAPGPVETPMLFANTPAEIEAERASVLCGRVVSPVEIAASIAFRAGPGGDAYVGQVLSPNGGPVGPG